ncbi:DNA-binding protein [Jaminaea rosea]|uniref:DNA-binding protein n=1 Tax=Jaminaea rosea TaxID=1569628 RepID=A0A316UIX9_9BASI|nr:DNA-binding protein [Jaminaea rosea]PWN25226.1 DNA-binding protein [Jaminaea rosea]
MATAQATATSSKTHLTLRGSTAIVSDFFNFSVQSILYQRGIYPAEDFRPVKKYGLQMLITTDDGLETYIGDCLKQVERWIEAGELTRLVVAIVEKESGETRERWQFDLEVTGKESEQPASSSAPPAPGSKKTDAQVKAEIAAIIKQITASCTFLPVIEEECAFQILAYTNSQLSEPVPLEWQDSDARLIAEGQAEQVKLRSFSTAIHKVDAVVAYRRGEEDE